MPTEEEDVRHLLRQMYRTVEATSWPISADDIRSQRRRRAVQMSNFKVLTLVAAVMIIILAVVLVRASVDSSGGKSHHVAVPSTATTVPTSSTTTTTTNESSRVVVPELVGEVEAQAESNLARVGLTVGQIHITQSARPAGIVLTQEPPAATSAVRGSSVMITVSSGPSGATTGGGEPSSKAPLSTAAGGAPTPEVSATPATTSSAPVSLPVSVTSVSSVLTPYPPRESYDAGIPEEQVSFTVTGMTTTGYVTCSVDMLQNGTVVGSGALDAGDPVSIRTATYTLSADVSLSVPTFSGAPSDAHLTCDS